MKALLPILSTILIIALLYGCKQDQESTSYETSTVPTLILKKDFQLTGYPTNVITRTKDVFHVFPDQSAFIVTNFDNIFFSVIDSSGAYINHFGQEGRGPTELLTVARVGFDQDQNIFVYDGNQDLIKSFSRDGSFLDAYTGVVEQQVWPRGDVMMLANGYWYMAAEVAGEQDYANKQSVARMEQDFSEPVTGGGWDAFYRNRSTILQQPQLTYDSKREQLIVVHRTSPNIRFIDLDLNETDTWHHRSPNFLLHEEDILRSHPPEQRAEIVGQISMVEQPFVAGDLLLFQFMNQNETFRQSLDFSDLEQFIGVYNLEDGTYYGEVELPHRLKGVIDNQLILLKDDDPDNFIIGLYEINLD